MQMIKQSLQLIPILMRTCYCGPVDALDSLAFWGVQCLWPQMLHLLTHRSTYVSVTWCTGMQPLPTLWGPDQRFKKQTNFTRGHYGMLTFVRWAHLANTSVIGLQCSSNMAHSQSYTYIGKHTSTHTHEHIKGQSCRKKNHAAKLQLWHRSSTMVIVYHIKLDVSNVP